MKSLLAIALLFAFSLSLSGQALPNAPSFTMSFNFLGSPVAGSTSGLDVGAAYQFTTYSRLRSDVWSIPSAGTQAFLFGADIDMWFACGLLGKTTLPCNRLLPYFGGAAGFGRVSLSNSLTATAPAGVLRVGANYDPTGTGHFTLNVAEVDCGAFPVANFANTGATTVFKCGYVSGIDFGLGTSQTASAKKMQRKKAAEARKAKKLQEAAKKSQ